VRPYCFAICRSTGTVVFYFDDPARRVCLGFEATRKIVGIVDVIGLAVKSLRRALHAAHRIIIRIEHRGRSAHYVCKAAYTRVVPEPLKEK
jgi:hypothetical protein